MYCACVQDKHSVPYQIHAACVTVYVVEIDRGSTGAYLSQRSLQIADAQHVGTNYSLTRGSFRLIGLLATSRLPESVGNTLHSNTDKSSSLLVLLRDSAICYISNRSI